MIISTVPASNCTPQTIVIGRRGTYDTMQIAFDLAYLIENYGSGTAVLAVKRSQDESAYPAVVTQEDNTLTWTVSETDTYYVGAGEAQLMWYVDGGLAKTIIYPMVVMRDILATAEEPPDGYENWIEHLTGLGAETQQNAQNAAQSASEAKVSEDNAAESAQRAEEAAELLTDVSATATTLEPENQATANYNNGVFEFGIPKGQKGNPLTYEDLTEEQKEELVQGPILDAQNAAVTAVGNARVNAVNAVGSAGTTAVNAVNQAGTTQVGNVNQAGTTQVQAVADKGAEVIGSIPPDYSDLAAEVDDLNRQLSDVDENQIPELKSAIGYGFLNTTDYTGDANDLNPGVSRVTASATHIPVAQVGYVITFARTESTAKSQIYINAPIGTYTGRCHLYARYLVSGTWSNWVDFASIDEVEAIPEQVWTNGTDYNGDLNSSPVGVSRVIGTATNNPAGEMGYVITISRAASAKAQIFITNKAIYFRTCTSGTWSAWNSTLKASTDRAVGYTFGDSLMAQDGKAFSYPNPQYNADEIGEICVGWQSLLHNEFGVTMTNYAVGGQGIAGQKPVIKSKTYTGIDFVIISVGVNDYSNAVQLGELPTARNATFTNGLFIDDLCESIEYILTQNPKIKILLFTPCQRDTTWRNSGVPDFSKSATDIYTQNSRGLYLKDYADAIKNIGRIYSCVVCDMYAESGLNYLTLPEFTFEGVHPTNEGYLFTSRALFEAFKKL